MKKISYFVLLSLIALSSCKNKDVNPINNDTLPMHERKPIKDSDFDTVTIEGSTYYIMERDRNNPHEGFGFMALKGTDILNKQDSILAYQQLLLSNQIRILERLENIPAADLEYEMQQQLEIFLNK